METLVQKLSSLLGEIYASIFEIKFIGIVDFDSGLSIVMKTGKWKAHEGVISAVLAEVGRFIQSKKISARNQAMRDVLKDFKKLMIETEKAFIIVTQIENTKFGLVAAIGKDGNLGLLMSKMKLIGSDLKKLLT